MQGLRAAIETAVANWGTAQSIPVAWENVIATMPVPHARFFLLPANSRTISLDGRLEERTGVIQVTLVLPAGKGPKGADTLFDSLCAAINPSIIFTHGASRLWLTSPMSRATGVPTADTYQVPVSANYWSSVSLN